jgi:hypothetical protein
MCVLDRAVLLHEEAHRVLWMEQFCCVEKHVMCYGWNSSAVQMSTLCIMDGTVLLCG